MAMPWDNLMIQVIVIILILLTLAFGLAYYAPSNTGSAYVGDNKGQLVDDTSAQITGGNLAGGATTSAPSPAQENQNLLANLPSIKENKIECNDGADNDDDVLIDLEDPECKNSWDASESTF